MADPGKKLEVANQARDDGSTLTEQHHSGSLSRRIVSETPVPAAKIEAGKAEKTGVQQTGSTASTEDSTAHQPQEQGKKSNPFKLFKDDYHPVATALSTRLAINGIRGHLLLDKAAAAEMLGKTGPLGEQLVGRLGTMESQGWVIERMRFNDPYLSKAFPNPLTRAMKFPVVAGYNALSQDGVMLKRVTYNSWSHLLNQSFGSYGFASPATRVVGNLAHELGHWDRVPIPDMEQYKTLTAAEQKTVALRLLQTETNAIIPQLHVTEKLGAFHPDIEIYREALKKGNLGSLLRNRWAGYGKMYEAFNQITPKEADAFVSQILETNYKGVVQPNGKVASYDLSSVRGKYFGHTSIDEQLLARIDSQAKGVAATESKLVSAIAESEASTAIRRGGQAVAGIGVALMATDIAAGFYESPQKGMGKVGRTALTWGAFELGSAGGAMIGAPIARMAMSTKYGYMALPVLSIVTGIGAAATADMMYGGKLEVSIQNALTKKPEDELRKTLLGK